MPAQGGGRSVSAGALWPEGLRASQATTTTVVLETSLADLSMIDSEITTTKKSPQVLPPPTTY